MTPEIALKASIMGETPAPAQVSAPTGRSGSAALRAAKFVGVVLITRVMLVGALVTGTWTFMQSDWARDNVLPLQGRAEAMLSGDLAAEASVLPGQLPDR